MRRVFCLIIIAFSAVSALRNKTTNFHLELDGRIVNGLNALITEFPYQASLMISNTHICGASIFHNSYILTAAHCISSPNPKWYQIRVGSTFLESGGVVATICRINVHEGYSAESMINDIAVLKLCQPLTFSDSILPIALAKTYDVIQSGTMAHVSGWGYTSEKGPASNRLKQVIIPIITTARCQSLYPDELITDGHICAGFVGSGKKDACQGDSGGPLKANGKLVGVVSWGYGCARPMYPGVYTKVAAYRNWIKRVSSV